MKKERERSHSTPIAFAVLEEIRKRLDEFTPRLRALAEYILQNPESLAFLSITDIAKKSGVAQTTIVRFCNVLGYDGYSHLVREARQAIQSELGAAGRFKIVRRMRKESNKNLSLTTFERLFEQELENIENLAKRIKSADFYRCIDLMAEVDDICIIGCMSSTSLAQFFGDMLSKAFTRVAVLHGHSVTTSAVFRRLTKKSLVFLISFPQYATSTEQLGRLAASNGSHIVAITDNNNSPIVPLADISFLIPVSIKSYMESYSAPIALISILVNAFSEKDPQKTEAALSRYDKYTSEMNLYKVSKERLKSRK
jgi:DNA-binding MurR/RpiR family transcriptional regulator